MTASTGSMFVVVWTSESVAFDRLAQTVRDQDTFNALMDALEQARLGAIYAQSLQDAQNAAAYAAAHPPAAPRQTSGSTGQSAGGGSSSGGCYAGPIPAYIVTRESGGNPGAVNASSGAYGCFQIMPYVWSANCGDLDRGVQGQIACANRISNGGSNLGPWAG